MLTTTQGRPGVHRGKAVVPGEAVPATPATTRDTLARKGAHTKDKRNEEVAPGNVTLMAKSLQPSDKQQQVDGPHCDAAGGGRQRPCTPGIPHATHIHPPMPKEGAVQQVTACDAGGCTLKAAVP